MFNFLTSKSDGIRQKSAGREDDATVLATQQWHIPNLLAVTLAGTVLLTGCQQPSEPSDADKQISSQADAETSKPVAISDSAAARIEQFQPLYVAQLQGLQRRLQAEYESLRAADTPDSNNNLLDTGAIETTPDIEPDDTDSLVNSTAAAETTEQSDITTAAHTNTAIEEGAVDTGLNTSTEVGERDLEVLKRISLEPREPEVLPEAQIIERYQQATQALYQPTTTALIAQDIDTLLNIATLLPQLFEHTEIAERLSVKSPALARIIVQHQVWKQIEEQQALDMQQMKLKQQQEFETLMAKFNDTIKDYDAQIAKYERLLKEFQD